MNKRKMALPHDATITSISYSVNGRINLFFGQELLAATISRVEIFVH